MAQTSRDRLYLFFLANYFAQGMIGIAYEPISYLLKDVLRLSAAGSAVFAAGMSLPFLVKPLMGMLSDALPLGRRRRTPYLILFSLATSAGWLVLASLRSYAYAPALVLLTSVNVGIAFTDVLCDGVMVQRGKELSKTGSYQAVQIGTLYATLLATGIGGGWMAAHASYRTVFALTSIFPLLILATTPLVSEEARTDPAQARLRAWRSAAAAARSRQFWTVCLVIFLYTFSPFLGTPLFYYQTDTLGFSKTFIGFLTSASGLAGVAGAGLFWRFYRKEVSFAGRSARLDTNFLVRWSVLLNIPLTLLYLTYRGHLSAVLLTVLLGVAGVFMRLSLMDLAAKSCPEHTEATFFALFMSVFNLAFAASNTVGGGLYERWSRLVGPRAAIGGLIILGAACTLACWPLLPGVMTRGNPAPEAAS